MGRRSPAEIPLDPSRLEAAPQAGIEPAGDRSLLVRFGNEVSPDLHGRVRRLFLSLLHAMPPGVVNLHPAYASLLVDFDPLLTEYETLARAIEARLQEPPGAAATELRRLSIPVCYGGEFGPDLDAVAGHCGLTPRQVIARHCANEYLVYFLGFSPGFPYLGGLDPALATPRLATPRTEVPAGSIAVGGSQAGIYPMASPGGWRLIGRTPVRLFDPAHPPFALLAMGDRVRFQPIPEREFAALAVQIGP